ncbi:cyclic pyranopterin monophosphate synthase [Moorella thermoacetica]|uniref:Cyclic pyranopterin monophosphate synthase n=1 Tax=Neomoorella thermoacetica TaxID=1525 RepID=A0A1J5NWU7_NEOTH|nr:cyclic pyranopterin monophosphate synthase [Moorella thermoacetica]
MYDMASVLFTGPCNADCVMCIGRGSDWPGNLDKRELPGLTSFLENAQGIECCSVSGINTDPLLYPYLDELAQILRKHYSRVTLHTNGLLLAERQEAVKHFTKVTVSLASFDDRINRDIMRVSNRKIIKGILNVSVPVKLSGILTETTVKLVDSYIENARRMGIKQVVFRQEVGKHFPVFEGIVPSRWVFGNPVYEIGGVEVTVWDFSKSTLRGLYLYPDGQIKGEFLAKRQKTG